MDTQTIATYNTLAQEYDQETESFWNLFPDTVLQKFAASVKGNRVLDIGCGPGRDALLLKKHDLDVTCLDASKSMVDMCKEKGFSAEEADLLTLPFSNESFDGVWAYTSLLHVQKKELGTALKEIVRVLTPSGVLGLGMIEGKEELYRESSDIHMPRWFAYYTNEELTEALTKGGLTVDYFDTIKPKKRTYLHYICGKKT